MANKVVLVVSPRFPPANAADCHRVRLCTRYYDRFGWRPIILCSDEPRSDSDDWALYDDIAAFVQIVRVKPWPSFLCRILGFNLVDFRAFFPILFRGLRLIYSNRVDVVFFSTTAFVLFLLGPIWKLFKRLSLVYDIQDPWYHGEQVPYNKQNAPGSWRKYRVMQLLARTCEPLVMKKADHVISVSIGYMEELRQRYAITLDRFTFLPFPGANEDFALAAKATQKIFDPLDRKIHWVYAGRGGPDMVQSIKCFFRALKVITAERKDLQDNLVIHFVGTNYAAGERNFKVVEPIAEEEGIQQYVIEHPQRVAYLEVLDLYKCADAVLLLGSHAAVYTASKVMNCILSNRPLFVLFHEKSFVWELLSKANAVYGCSFGSEAEDIVDKVVCELRRMCDEPGEALHVGLEPWLALENAKIQCQVFDKVLT